MSDPFGGSNAAPIGGDPFQDEEFGEARVQEEEVLPPTGQYVLVVEGISKGVSKSSGNPMYMYETCILSDMQGNEKWKGFRPKTLYTVLQGPAGWRSEAMLRNLGLQPDEKGEFHFKRSDVISKIFVANIEEDEYNGRKQRVIGTTFDHPKGPGQTFTGQLPAQAAGEPTLPPAADADAPF